VLTLSKVVVEVGNRADAARAGDYRLELEAAPEAFARGDYQLAEEGLERRSGRGSSVLWLGFDDALAQFGVRRGQPIERDDLIAVLQGQHVETGEQLRRPGLLKRGARDEHGQGLRDDGGRPVVQKVTGVAHVEMTMSVPKSVSVLWAMADQDDREKIEHALIAAAERTVQYMARTKAVVHRRGRDGVRVREPAAGAAVASSLHVTARRARGDRAPTRDRLGRLVPLERASPILEAEARQLGLTRGEFRVRATPRVAALNSWLGCELRHRRLLHDRQGRPPDRRRARVELRHSRAVVESTGRLAWRTARAVSSRTATEKARAARAESLSRALTAPRGNARTIDRSRQRATTGLGSSSRTPLCPTNRPGPARRTRCVEPP
jgi:TrwC relaxase